MAIKRMDNVAIVVEDLDAAITYFKELGMDVVGKAAIEGQWADRVVGLRGIASDIALMQTPDGYSKIELTKFRSPEISRPDLKDEKMNVLGKHRIMFTVDDIQDTVSRLQKLGAKLVDEIVQYENSYLLCYITGPEGITVALAEEIS
jgi:catechol 2,3-dioxygenase-like lactoylglutathione lyase family enzyme